MQCLLYLHSSYGLPLCLSGIANPLSFSKEMADHDLRREAMKRQKSQAREVFGADQEMGMQGNVERVTGEMREGEDVEDPAKIVQMLSRICLLPCSAKAA